MDSIINILSGTREESLNIDELKEIIVQCFATKDYSEKTRIQLNIIDCIKNSYINPNNIILLSVSYVQEIVDINLISLALRLNGNPNLYTNSNIGNAHILVYTFNVLKKRNINLDLINIILLVLILLGSDISLNSFNDSTISVKDYFETQGFVIPKYEEQNEKNKLNIATICDRSDLINGTPNFEAILLARGINVLKIYNFTNDTKFKLNIEKKIKL